MNESAPQLAEANATQAQPVVVKKYANRRLYNTESSSYITLDSLADMVRNGRDFVVYDAKSGEDITRSVLTQIIVEEEAKGRALLPTAFLRQLIGFYGDNMQTLVPRYLEQALTAFTHQQEQMRRAMQQTMGSLFPFNIEEVGRQNRAMMERAMTMFTPFHRPAGDNAAEDGTVEAQYAQAAPSAPPPPPAPVPQENAELVALRAEIETLRRELETARESKPAVAPAPAPVPVAAPVEAAPPSLTAPPITVEQPIPVAVTEPARESVSKPVHKPSKSASKVTESQNPEHTH